MLLMTVASGAWAEEVTIGDGTETTYYFPIDNFFNYSCTEEIYTAKEIGTKGTINAISFYYSLGTPYEASNVKMFMKHVTRSEFGLNDNCEPLSETDLVWTGNIAPTGAGWFTFTLDTPFEYNGKDNLLVAFYDGTDGHPGTSYQWRKTTSPGNAIMAVNYYSDTSIPDPYNLSSYSGNKSLLNNRANIKLDIEPSSVEISDDMTTATFTMPASDATVNYDIVRDMEDETYPVEFSGLAQKVVVKKKTGSEAYEPLTPLTIQLIDQLAATDAQNIIANAGIKVKVLKGSDNNGTITYDETNSIPYADFLADMKPGLYKMVAEPTDATTSLYTGTASLAFETLAGYPVEIAAHGFVTYYSDEKLTINDDAAKIYTVQQVTGNKAVLSSAINVAPANTPLIIYNTNDEPKTFLLIPADGDADEVSYAAQFKGTLVDRDMPGSDDETDYYVCNGFDFAWVKLAGTLAANRCWLEIKNQSQGARTINIVFGDGTGLNAIGNGQLTNADGDLYDLNGRKVAHGTSSNATLRKGIYIQNGKKVIKK